MKFLSLTSLLLLLGLCNLTNLAGQVIELPLGSLQQVGYSGTYVDYQIPEMNSANMIYLKVAGGDGGAVGLFDNGNSGKGATIEGYLQVGNASSIPGGSILRLIIGQKGNKGGGGGATAVAVQKKGQTNWTLVMVAGGGGGSGHYNPGIEGQSGTGGAAGKNRDQSLNNAGTDGMGGGRAGGGGYKGDGGGFSDVDQTDPRVQKVIGKKGNNANNEPVGAAGGQGDDGSYGGFGYGSGGGGLKDGAGHLSGGGGGGYSGGGGGGSYVNPTYINDAYFLTSGTTFGPENGYIGYSFSNIAPFKYVRLSIDNTKCLEQNNNTINGGHILLNPCAEGSPAQQWAVKGSSIHWQADPGKCLDLDNSNTADGTKIQLWDCNGTNAQKWIYDVAVQAIRSTIDFHKCLDLTSSNTTDGANIQLHECNGTNAQRFMAYKM